MGNTFQTCARPARSRRRILILAAGLLVAAPGALAASKTPASKVAVPQQWTTTDPSFKTSSIEDMSHWWDRLRDPILTRLIERSLIDSPDVRTAQIKLRESRARRQLAVANRLPSLTASWSGTRSQGSNGSYQLGSSAEWDPDISGAKRNAQRAAEADYLGTASDLHQSQLTLASEVASDYVQLRAYQVRLEITRRNEASQTETLQLTQWREQAGLVSSVDVQQAQASRDQTRAQIPSLETSIVQTQHALEALAGVTPGALTAELAASAAIPSPPDELAIGIPAETLRQRPDVRTAETRILAETARLAQQRAARYPSFSLTGTIGLETITSVFTGSTTGMRSAVGNLTQTLFDSGRIRQNILLQTAVQEEAVVNYESTVLTALKEVENALISFSKDRERLASLTTAAEAARNAASLAKNRYAAGLVDFQTVLDTERTALSLEDSLASTQADRTTALIQLYQALGGGWTTPTSSANSKGN